MRLLIVGLPTSIHLYRATSSLLDQGWDIHLFPSVHLPWLPEILELEGVTLHHVEDHPAPTGGRATTIDHSDERRRAHRLGDSRARVLAGVVETVRPDIVHAQEILQAGYLVEAARHFLTGPLPPWVLSNWGSDLFLWSRTEQRDSLRAVLAHCDAYWAECHRDVGLAWSEGFRGTVLPVLPVAGGFDLDRVRELRQPGPTSQRRTIAVKGYSHWIARNDQAIRSLLRCRDLLDGLTVTLYGGASDELVELARNAERFGAQVEVLGFVSYEEILALHGRSRLSIGLSISDGTSVSFLEAIACGSFPVQSTTACAGEWVIHGRTGMLVDHRDSRRLDAAIRSALSDDTLVDDAVARNDRVVSERLDAEVIRARVVEAYESVLAAARGEHRASGVVS